MSALAQQLASRGIVLPAPAAPVASYVATRREGGLLFVSGQLPKTDTGIMHKGIVGKDVSVAQAKEAARLCGLHILAQVEAAAGLDAVQGCVRLGGFVASVPEFESHPDVVNGASDLMLEVFGDAGRHSRAAVGVASLPAGAPVEIEAIFAVY